MVLNARFARFFSIFRKMYKNLEMDEMDENLTKYFCRHCFTYLIGPFYAGPYWRYFWACSVIRAGVKRAENM